MSQLKRIEIKNIKAINTFSIDFLDNKKLVLLIGRNNSGKTSILEAIKLFFSDEKSATEFWPLNPDGTYKDLNENPYILVEIDYTAEEIENLKSELSKTKQDIKLEEHLIENKLILRKPLQKDSSNKIQAKIIECRLKDKETFKNFTGITQVLSKFLPRFVYLPSIANLEDYQSASERAQHNFEELFEIYFEGLRWEDDDEVKVLVSNLVSKINEKIGISDIKQQLKNFLSEIDEIKIADLKHGFQGVNDVSKLIKKVKILLDDGIISDATLKGSGIQRLLIFCLLRLIAEQRRYRQLKDTIFLIDEPDLHLHPQLQKKIKVILEKLSSNYPVIVATHSHLMIGTKLPANCVIKKIYKENNIVKEEYISNEEKFFRELFTYLGYIPSDFLLPDNFILVGGQLDKDFLDKLIEILKNNKASNSDGSDNNSIYDTYNVSVINVGGDGQINKVVPFLKNLESAVNFFQGLPVYKDRFCMILDAKKEKSLHQLRINANDNRDDDQDSHRIIVLNYKKDTNGNSLDGIEFYYPESLTEKYCNEYHITLEEIVKDDTQKRKLSDYILNNLTINHFPEIKEIIDLIKLSFEKAKIL